MKYNHDAFGNEIWSYYKNKYSFEVIERDDGYINVSPGAKSYFSNYKNWEQYEKDAIKYVHGKSLDVGCGAGRVILYLQKRNNTCIGIDSSFLAVKVCRLRGAKNVKVMDISNIKKLMPNKFNSIIMFGNNFGLMKNKTNAKKLLKQFFSMTYDDAVIVAEDRDPYITNNQIHFAYLDRNRQLGRMPGQIRIRARFMQYTSKWFDYLYVSKDEMTNLISGTGWEIKTFIDSKNYKENGQYIAIMVKK